MTDDPAEPTASPPTPAPPPHWSTLPEAELLHLRVCDLRLEIPGSPIEPFVDKLHQELATRGIGFRPILYLGDEWFSPEDVPAIAIPFYFAHPRLVALEQKFMLEVEGGEPAWFQKLLRHETGHAIEHAYGLHRRRRRKQLFGPRTADYDPDHYRPQPYSKSFVKNLPNWYAQAHPDEDWAETFAVWLDPEVDWRRQYAGWKALQKLQYVDEVMKEIGPLPQKVSYGRLECQAARMRVTLEGFYRRRRKQYAEDAPDFYDRDLMGLFHPLPGAVPSQKTAAAFFRRHKRELVESVARWTGERKVTIESMVKRLQERAEALGLSHTGEESRTTIEVTAWLATLVTHYQFTGRFKRTV
jgi:hypothetical protein